MRTNSHPMKQEIHPKNRKEKRTVDFQEFDQSNQRRRKRREREKRERIEIVCFHVG
jgi:hypothetical protein